MAQLVEERTGWRFAKEQLKDHSASILEGIIRAYEMDIFYSSMESFIRSENKESIGRDVYKMAAQQTATATAERWVATLKHMSSAEQLVEVYEKLVEPTLINPTFVTNVPSVIIPLAKKNCEDSYFADVYELAINGQEISPGYSELNDPDVQAANFAQQVGDEAEKQKTDEDFLTALKFGMPPAGGMGLGIDRLVMMLTGAESIRDVILFPLMRPHGGEPPRNV